MEEEAGHEAEKRTKEERTGNIQFVMAIIAGLIALGVIYAKNIEDRLKDIWDSQVSQRQTEQILKIAKVLNGLDQDE